MSAAPRPAGGWQLQIHSAGGRRVRCYQVTPLRLNLAILLLVLVALPTLAGLALAPRLVRHLISADPAGPGGAERSLEMRRLQALLGRVDELYPRSRESRIAAQTLLVAYGLTATGSQQLPGARPAAASGEDPLARGRQLLDQTSHELAIADELCQQIESFQHQRPEQVRLTPSIRPLTADSDSFVLVSGFGERDDPFTGRREFHPGIDLAAPEGTPVVATADGVVAFAGSFQAGGAHNWWRLGNLVLIEHGSELVTVYGHCRDFEVRAGQRVRRGQVIATVGSTGWSRVPHLHYEVRRRGASGLTPADPRLFILDQRWGDPDALLAQAGNEPGPDLFDPLPAGLR